VEVIEFIQPSGEGIRAVQTAGDLEQFTIWLSSQHRVAVDTETSGLNIYQPSFELRLVIVATSREAWVIPNLNGWGFLASMALDRASLELIFHNASFDLQVLQATTGLDMAATWGHSRCTRILGHLIDPRGREEGGTGHSLDELANWYLGAPKLKGELRAEAVRLRGVYKDSLVQSVPPLADYFKWMPLDNEVFIRYAGQDGLLTAQLFDRFNSSIKPPPQLITFEHELAAVVSQMDSKGFLLDLEYAQQLAAQLLAQEQMAMAAAKDMGLENINSPVQVLKALEARGIHSDRFTPGGQPTVDKVLLARHSKDPLVHAIIEGKRAGKWRKTWVEKFVSECDANSRVHPSTNTLRARTARFSVTGIPAQTLPATDSLIRNCFVADAGQRIVSADYSQQELRYAAAASRDARLIRMLAKGDDPYQAIADDLGGTRKEGKLTALATLYGVGQAKLAEQIGSSEETAARLRQGFRSNYPHLTSYGQQLANEAREAGSIITASGRRLPVDSDRTYAALNYYVQSGCRDVTARALTELASAGYIKNMRLAIHDEVVLSLPDGADLRDIEAIMSVKVDAVDLPAKAKMGGASWGSLYVTAEAADHDTEE
jgi:DNA polymerase I